MRHLIMAVIVTAVTLSSGVAFSQGTPPMPAGGSSENLTAILICNEVVLRLRAPVNNMSAMERTKIVRDRIIQAYANEEIRTANFRLVPIGQEWAIYVGGTLLVTAGYEEARANNTTPRALAEVWHHNLSTAMPRCPATVPPTMGR